MKLNLPKPYLSYSAIQLWLKNKKEFRDKYYLNIPQHKTREMLFGIKLARMLELKTDHPVLNKVPRGEVPEYRIETKIKGVPILAFLDSFSPSNGSIWEFKSGRIPWTQERVNEHLQLPIYALAVKKHLGFVNPIVTLVWLPTKLVSLKETIGGIEFENPNEKIELTGEMFVFKKEITNNDLVIVGNLIKKVAKEISEDYREFLGPTCLFI